MSQADALLVKGNEAQLTAAAEWLRSNGLTVIEAHSEGNESLGPLRDRMPDLYQSLLGRYEESVKRVLQNRIYKTNDDAFEPFRQLAKEFFEANATARDVVQLHYQTLRKMAPTPDAPGALGYLEVGRTTIIGLMGDLLTYYRDARNSNGVEKKAHANGPSMSLETQP